MRFGDKQVSHNPQKPNGNYYFKKKLMNTKIVHKFPKQTYIITRAFQWIKMGKKQNNYFKSTLCRTLQINT